MSTIKATMATKLQFNSSGMAKFQRQLNTFRWFPGHGPLQHSHLVPVEQHQNLQGQTPCRHHRGVKCAAIKATKITSPVQNDVNQAVLIAGAGLAGLNLAAALEKVGIPYYVLEQRGELSQEGAAIALWRNALTALDAVGVLITVALTAGVASAVRKEFLPMDSTRLCRDNGTVLKEFSFDECSENPELIGIPRGRLQQTSVVLEDGSELKAKVVVGADGLRSAVARGLNIPHANFTGQAGFRGLASFEGPAPAKKRTVCQIWSADGVRAGLYPVTESSVYWFIAFDCDGKLPSQSPDEFKAIAAALVRGWEHGIEECVLNTPADKISRSRFFDKWPSPTPVVQSGSFTLCGDALHPMTPNLGQGGCTALEDGIVLTRMLCDVWGRGNQDEIERTLREFEKQRSIRCIKLAVRSNLIGKALQNSNPAVVAARDIAVKTVVNPKNFFNHALYDCGSLPDRY